MLDRELPDAVGVEDILMMSKTAFIDRDHVEANASAFIAKLSKVEIRRFDQMLSLPRVHAFFGKKASGPPVLHFHEDERFT